MRRDTWVPDNPDQFATYLRDLRDRRYDRKAREKSSGNKRRTLTRQEREVIFKKTDGRCHICGGEIDGQWEADHVLAHSGGGEHYVDNYLPAHRVCNNYRWDYLPEEFQEVMRLGVWLKTRIEYKEEVGRFAAEEYIKYEKRRIGRRKTKD